MDEDSRRFLRERVADATVSAHLATSVDDRPHVAPVWYTYEERDGDGVFRVLTGGRKLRNVRENPRVSLSIEQAGDDTDHEERWRVVALGTAETVEDPDAIATAREAVLEKYYGPEHDPESAEEGGVLVEITVGTVDLRRY